MPLYTTRTATWSACGGSPRVFNGSNGLVPPTLLFLSLRAEFAAWTDCDFFLASTSGGGYSCAWQFCVSRLAGLGYPWMCAFGRPEAGGDCTFTSVAWPGAPSTSGPDRAHRNCTHTPCTNTTRPGYGGTDNWDCECLYCGTGTNVTWDPATQLCYVCPAGTCYCASVGDCVNCSPPPCATQLSCYWDTQGCAWHCDTPTCPTGQGWSSTECKCVASDPPPPPPPCAAELGCTYDSVSRTWPCTDDPATVCPAGYHWDWLTCSCTTNCTTPGQCWCVTGTCIDCSHLPDCFEERDCQWDMNQCGYVCTDPECPPGEHFSLNGCRCRPAGEDDTPWLLQAPPHWHEQALTRDGQIRYQRIQSPVPVLPLPFDAAVAEVPEHGTDSHPRMVVNWQGARELIFHREIVAPGTPSSDTLLTISDDDGDTWSEPVEFMPNTKFSTISGDQDSPLLVAAARSIATGAIKGRKKWKGDPVWGPVYTMQVDDGTGTLVDLVLDATTFHLVLTGETSGRGTLIGVQDGNSELFLASDDYETWKKVP